MFLTSHFLTVHKLFGIYYLPHLKLIFYISLQKNKLPHQTQHQRLASGTSCAHVANKNNHKNISQPQRSENQCVTNQLGQQCNRINVQSTNPDPSKSKSEVLILIYLFHLQHNYCSFISFIIVIDIIYSFPHIL